MRSNKGISESPIEDALEEVIVRWLPKVAESKRKRENQTLNSRDEEKRLRDV